MASSSNIPSYIFILFQHCSTNISLFLFFVIFDLVSDSLLKLELSFLLCSFSSIFFSNVVLYFPRLYSRSSHCLLFFSTSAQKLLFLLLFYLFLIAFILTKFKWIQILAKYFQIDLQVVSSSHAMQQEHKLYWSNFIVIFIHKSFELS